MDGEYCGFRPKPSRRGGRPPKYCPPHRGYRPHARTEAPRLRLVLPEGTPEPTGKVAERGNAELERVAGAPTAGGGGGPRSRQAGWPSGVTPGVGRRGRPGRGGGGRPG